MKTTELKNKYNELNNTQREATSKYENGTISGAEWLSIIEATDRKFAGWRRSAINYLAKVCGTSYKEMACRCYNNDNIDLYSTYFK